MNNFTYNLNWLDEVASLGWIFVLIVFFIFICILPILIIYIIGRWKLYQKAGKNGWESIVPFYNDWVYVEIAGLNPWWFLALIAVTVFNIFNIDDLDGLATLASLVAFFFCNYNISKKLHKDTVFAVLMTIFPFVLIPIVGLSNNYNWDNSVIVNEHGPINENKNMSNNKEDSMNEEKNDTKNKETNKDKKIMYCTNCGNKISKDDKFCSKCGKEI